jgi:hypothetical protein
MILYISDEGKLVNDPNFLLPVTALDFKRGDNTTIRLKFLSGTTPLAADPARVIEFGCKPTGVYDTNFTVYADTYVIDGNDFYVFNPNFNTVALDELLNNDADDTNDIASVTLISEFTWSDDLRVSWNSTQTYNAIVANDVIRNNEDTPLANPEPLEWLCTNLNSLSCSINIINPPSGGSPEFSNKIITTGFGGSIVTGGYEAPIATFGQLSPMYTSESTSGMFTLGNYSEMYTAGNYAPIYTLGTNSHILAASLSSSIGIGLGSTSGVPNVPPSHIALDIKKNTIRIQGQKTPNAGMGGTVGEICFDNDAMYYYKGGDFPTWVRLIFQAMP